MKIKAKDGSVIDFALSRTLATVTIDASERGLEDAGVPAARRIIALLDALEAALSVPSRTEGPVVSVEAYCAALREVREAAGVIEEKA